MPKSTHNTAYRSILTRPLLRRIGHRIDPNNPPFGYSGGAEDWRQRVGRLRSNECQRVGTGLEALRVELGVSQPSEWSSDSKLTSREKYFCDLFWALARKHVPAFKHMDTPVSESKGIAQDGQEGAAPAIDTTLLHSVEYYRRILAKEAELAQSQLSPNEMAKKILAAIAQMRAQDGKTLSHGGGYRGAVPHLKTVERLLSQIEGAFDAVLDGRGSSTQCEYVEHVCKTLDGLDRKPWL